MYEMYARDCPGKNALLTGSPRSNLNVCHVAPALEKTAGDLLKSPRPAAAGEGTVGET
jgi:hypothetical protein